MFKGFEGNGLLVDAAVLLFFSVLLNLTER